jgi:glycosyltransferase involved in cell wall biosynthesis
MAAGRAVVASRIGQIEEIVTDGTNGVLCAPGSVAELTSALHMLHDNPDRRRQLGAAARRAIAKSYTWGGVLQRILQTVDLGPRSTGAKC